MKQVNQYSWVNKWIRKANQSHFQSSTRWLIYVLKQEQLAVIQTCGNIVGGRQEEDLGTIQSQEVEDRPFPPLFVQLTLRSRGCYWNTFFKASALWADAFYKSKCPSVCPCVCVSVCLFTFEVPFNGLFAPISRS